MLPFAFEPGMGFERYVDYALDVPMYFVKREDEYIDVSGMSFRDLLAGKLPGHGNLRATLSDWVNHVGTIFPEVRLKRYMEMRGSDAGPWRRLPALPAYWVGLLYDDVSLDAAWDLCKDWSAAERQKLRDDVTRAGFKAQIRGRSLLDLARDTLALAEAGLKRRKRLDHEGRDETRYLGPLQEFVARGITPAEELLEKYHGPWGKSVEPVFSEYAY
jgi:glutamate--cysteine ligase